MTVRSTSPKGLAARPGLQGKPGWHKPVMMARADRAKNARPARAIPAGFIPPGGATALDPGPASQNAPPSCCSRTRLCSPRRCL